LISDATASGIKKHYETTLERVRDYYGIVTNLQGLKKMVGLLEQITSGKTKYDDSSDKRISEFLERHKLIDVRKSKRSRKQLV
jgi:ureidoacrylate peracid hydrolase